MSEYDGEARPLRWPLTNPLVYSTTTEDDGDCSPSSFVWPEDSDERVVIPFYLSLNEYVVLSSTIDVGADLAYGEDALRVTWLWLRNMRCEVPMCGCCPSPAPSFNDRVVSQSFITTTTNEYTDIYNTWNTAGQTVASVAPDLDYDTGDPVDIEKLICLAVQMFMVAIVESAKLNKAGTDAQNRDIVKNLANVMAALGTAGGAALAVGGSAAALVAFLGGPYVLMGVALAGVGLAIANLVYTTDNSVFTDNQAFNDVKCVMINNLSGASVTRDAFIGALAGAGFDPASNAGKLAAIVQPYLYDLNTYLQFLTTGQGLYEVSDFGVLPDCPCYDPEECTDLTTTNGGYAPVGANQALWHDTDPEGWGPGPANGSYIWMRQNFSGLTITSVYLRLNQALIDQGTVFVAIYAYDDTGQAEPIATSVDPFQEFTFADIDIDDGLAIYVSTNNLLGDIRLVEVCLTFA